MGTDDGRIEVKLRLTPAAVERWGNVAEEAAVTFTSILEAIAEIDVELQDGDLSIADRSNVTLAQWQRSVQDTARRITAEDAEKARAETQRKLLDAAERADIPDLPPGGAETPPAASGI